MDASRDEREEMRDALGGHNKHRGAKNSRWSLSLLASVMMDNLRPDSWNTHTQSKRLLLLRCPSAASP